MKRFLRQLQKRLVLAAALALLGGALLASAGSGFLPGVASAADPLPPGKKCPTDGDAYSAALGQCTRSAGIDPATQGPSCPTGYSPAANSYDCLALPIDDPATAPPTTPGTPPAAKTCANPIDHLDAPSGLCVHTNSGTGCMGVYVLIANNLCATNPTLSKPGAEMGSAGGGDPDNRTGDPKCAIMTLGVVACPINVGAATENCYVWDRTNNKSGGWEQTDCGGELYKRAANPKAIDCSNDATSAAGCDTSFKCNGSGSACNVSEGYLKPAIKALSALVGIGVTASIIWGGIQYSASSGDPRRVAAARKKITIAVMVLIGYFLLYAFLNWIVPGGIGA